MARLYISPTGAGLRDGSSMANAATLGSLSSRIAAAGPGGEVLLLADQGSYRPTAPITISKGGGDGAPVTIRGIDSNGNTMAAEIVGTRPENWSLGQNVGHELFRLAPGADNLSFQDLSVRNIGNGAFRIGADIENLTIRHVDAQNVHRFVENYVITGEATATVSGLTVQDVTVTGYGEGAIRLQYDSHDIRIEDVKGDSQRQNGGLYIMGVHLDDTVHDVLILRVQMDNNYGNGAPNEYWNGDGFGSERGVYNIRLEDTSASGNTDAGYDLKSSNTVLVNAFAAGNKKNYRLWSDSITVEDSISLSPKKLGGSNDTSHVWLRDGAIATLKNFMPSDLGAPTTLFDLSDGGSVLRLINTAIPNAYVDKIRLFDGSRIEIITPAEPGAPSSPDDNDAPTRIDVSGGTLQENAAAGTIAATLKAVDPDIGNTHSFALAGGATDKFEIVGTQIRVRAGAQLDYETQSAYQLDVVVSDQGGATHRQTVVVNLTDVNETGALNLAGTSRNDVLLGGSGGDTLTGMLGNDTLQGGAGQDRIVGGAGKDKAYGGDDADSIYGGSGNDTLWGDRGDDQLFGEGGIDTLNGGAGSDRLDGGAGNDKMSGGAGNDTYVVNAGKETLTELAGQGVDTVESSVSHTLGANLENLFLKGSSAINGTGNGLANTLVGNGAANILKGGAGSDILDGGAGNDTLTGGQGADTYLFGRSSGRDVINNIDTDRKPDKLVLGAAIDADDVWFSKSGSDLVISIIGTGDKATLKAWYTSSANRLDRLELSDGTTLDGGDVQQLVNAMSFTAAPPSSLSALTAAQRNAVEAAIDATWEP